MYKLSRDYKKLFQLICEGHVAAAFVDYRFEDGVVFRDICQIKRHGPYSINIGVRGISYGDIHPFMERDGAEEDVFIRNCMGANLEWVEPGEMSPCPP